MHQRWRRVGPSVPASRGRPPKRTRTTTIDAELDDCRGARSGSRFSRRGLPSSNGFPTPSGDGRSHEPSRRRRGRLRTRRLRSTATLPPARGRSNAWPWVHAGAEQSTSAAQTRITIRESSRPDASPARVASACGSPGPDAPATGTPDPALTTTRKKGRICGESSVGKHFQSIDSQVLSRIYGHRGGWVFTPASFLDLGSRVAVASALTRHKRAGIIRQLARGLYDYPVEHPKLGRVAPPADGVARAIARRDAVRLQPAGAYAANVLGLRSPTKIALTTGLRAGSS
jgi:hypothetical protein